eukprot:15451640-Alexandrium_andersonii.AAC.2
MQAFATIARCTCALAISRFRDIAISDTLMCSWLRVAGIRCDVTLRWHNRGTHMVLLHIHLQCLHQVQATCCVWVEVEV